MTQTTDSGIAAVQHEFAIDKHKAGLDLNRGAKKLHDTTPYMVDAANNRNTDPTVHRALRKGLINGEGNGR